MADCSNTPTPESTANFDLDSRCFSEAMTSNSDYTTSKASDGNVKKTFAAALREAGWEHVGEWSTNPLVTESNQVIPYAGTNQRFRPLSIPYQVDSATHPDPNALLPDPSTGYAGELVDVSEYVGKSEVSEYAPVKCSSVADMKSKNLKLGDTVTWASYYDGWAALDEPPKGGNSGSVVSRAALIEDDGSVFFTDNGLAVVANQQTPLTACQFGAKGDGVSDDYAQLQKLRNWALISNERLMTLDAGCNFAVSQSPFIMTTSKTLRVEGAGQNSTDITMLSGNPFSLFTNDKTLPEEQSYEMRDFKVIAPQEAGYNIFDFRGMANGLLIENIRSVGGDRLFKFQHCFRFYVSNVFAESGLMGLEMSDSTSVDDIVFMLKFQNVTWRYFRNITDIDFERFTNTAVIDFDTCNFEFSSHLACRHNGANVSLRNCYIENNQNPDSDALFIDQTNSVMTINGATLIHYDASQPGVDKCVFKTDRPFSFMFGEGIQWKLNKSGLGAVVRGPKGSWTRLKQGRQGDIAFTNYGDTITASGGSEYMLRDEQFSKYNTQPATGYKTFSASEENGLIVINFGSQIARETFSFKARATAQSANYSCIIEADIMIEKGSSFVTSSMITSAADQVKLSRGSGANPEFKLASNGFNVTVNFKNSTSESLGVVWEITGITSRQGDRVIDMTKS